MMKHAFLAAVVSLSASFASAQVGRAPAIVEEQPERPAPSCVCDRPGFKAITEKAVAAEAYWHARRKTKISTAVSGGGVMLGLIFGNPQMLNEATQSYERARSEMNAARVKAEALGALKVTGDDMDGVIEFRLKKGVDFVID